MKRFLLLILISVSIFGTTYAQRSAYIDSDYIMEMIPAYKSAKERLNIIAGQYRDDLNEIKRKIDKMKSDLSSERVLLSKEMIEKRESVIEAEEVEYSRLNISYFGPNGELFKEREALIKPIEDMVASAVLDVANAGGYSMVFDKSKDSSLIFGDPKYDLSNKVLSKLGYTDR